MGNRRELFKLLFDASSQTLRRFAQDEKYLGAIPGIVSILHTWGQQLSFHPHVHCIVSGGGIRQGKAQALWIPAKKNDWRFLFPVKAMNKVFRALYLEGLKRLLATQSVAAPSKVDILCLIKQLYLKDWVVYAKAPFGGPQQVIEYLGRYTHKVAISNHRIREVDASNKMVTFCYKDYAQNGTTKQMTLAATEFIRRFKQHILPADFTKIRSYGYLANRGRQQRITSVIQQLQLPPHPVPIQVPCPHCRQRTLQLIAICYPRNHSPDNCYVIKVQVSLANTRQKMC